MYMYREIGIVNFFILEDVIESIIYFDRMVF